MRRLLVTILLAVLMASCLVGTSCASDDVAKLLGDKNYWSSFDWTNPEGGRLFSSVPWSRLGMKQLNAFKFAHQLRVNDLPVVLYAMRNTSENTEFGDFDVAYSTFDRNENASVSNRLLSWCISNYGDKYVRINNIKRNYKSQNLDISYVYWQNGNTLIRFATCKVIDNGVQFYITRISYLDSKYNKIRSPEIIISCELDITKLDKEIMDFFTDKITYKIDETDKVIKDLDDNVISDDFESSDIMFKFTKKTETMLKVSIINKLTGDYSYKLFYGSNNAKVTPDIVITGKCNKMGFADKTF